MIRLIVSDFDGTLVPYGTRIASHETHQSLIEAIDRGVTVAVSSGRTYNELAESFPDAEEKLWFICCDGAYAVKNRRVFYERRILSEDLRLLEKNLTGGASMILHGAMQNYAIGRIPEEGRRFAPETVSSTGAIREKIFKVTTYGVRFRLPPYCGLRTHWDGGACEMAQFVNRFANKGTALSDLQSRLILTKFDTACIGDSGNDIAMMHNAKIAVCVGDRSEELKKVCTHHTATVEEALKMLLCI